MRRSLSAVLAILFPVIVAAQAITVPPSGDNQRSSVTQQIGPVSVTIDYSSPDVHAPNGEDRRGKIWGTDVAHFGFRDEAFGTCTQCPWRAGANENTVFTVSHDVKIEGQTLPAHKHLFVEPNPIPVKWAMARMGLCGGALRLPMTPLSEALQPVVEAALRSAGVLQ